MSKESRYVTEGEAAKILGVARMTVKRWEKEGRLTYTERKRVVVTRLIPRSALKKAFEVTCGWCGEVFTAKHPEKARFCCVSHRNKWYYRTRRRKKRSTRRA